MTISKSFQDLHDELYAKGIKDVGFLVYTNPELKGIDPYADDLTNGQKVLVMTEVCSNFWYFLRDVVKVCSTKTITHTEQYQINRGSLGSLWLAYNNHNVYSVLAWRCSNVTSQAIWCLWKLITVPNYRCRVLDVRPDMAIEFMQRVKLFNSLLPEYMKVDSLYIEDNVQIIENPKSIQQADNAGRGCTLDVYVINLENIQFIDIFLKSIFPVLSLGRTKLYATGFIGEKGTHGKITGDQLSSNSKKWFDEMLDIELKNKEQIIYNSMPFDYIRKRDEIEELKKLFNNDYDILNRHVYLQR